MLTSGACFQEFCFHVLGLILNISMQMSTAASLKV